jgi:HlyD family secretion protein
MAELSRQEPSGAIDALLGLRPSTGRAFVTRWKRLLLAVGVLAALAAGWLGYAARGVHTAVRYITAPAVTGDLHIIVTATGSVQPTTKVDISSELSGIVRRVFVDYNSPVKRGQVLAVLDTDKLSAAVENSRAKLAAFRAKVTELEATIAETARELERKTALAARDFSSQREFDVARFAHNRAIAQLASARADVIAAEADLKINETNLGKASIHPPIDGIVLKRSVDPGQTVASSLQAPVLFTIAEDLTKMEAQVDIDEADVGKVREGQTAIFTVDAYPDRKFPAKLRELRYASETVQGVVTYKGILTVDNSELLLRPGMTATAEIAVQEIAGALLVPNAALRFVPPADQPAGESISLLNRLIPVMPRVRPASQREDTGPARKVWVLRDASAVAVPVTVGASDGRRTQIVQGGLKPGDAVIVDLAAAKR